MVLGKVSANGLRRKMVQVTRLIHVGKSEFVVIGLKLKNENKHMLNVKFVIFKDYGKILMQYL